MSQATSAPATDHRARPPRIRHPRRRTLVALAAGVVVVATALATVVPVASDAARAKIVAALADRMDSDVELQDLRLRLFPRLRAEGHGLKIRHKGRRDVPPLISIPHFFARRRRNSR